jgi:CP family cyanate transporter-like MFS transporter
MARIESPFAQPLLLAAVVAVGLNLRPFLTGVGPLAGEISADTGLGLQGMALVTLLPMLMMGAFAFAGPSLEGSVGARRAVVGALAVLALGSFLRLFVTTGWAMLGTAVLLGLGVAIVQAVFPGVIKRQFPRQLAVVTGLYSGMMMGGGALGAQLAPIVAGASGSWRIALAWLAAPALLAVVMAARLLPPDGPRVAAQRPALDLLRRPRAWLLMACFGLVNGGYASVVAWLPAAYQAHGWSGAASGGLLAVLAVAQAVAALMMPVLVRRRMDRRPWIWLALAMQATGYAGIALAPETAPVAWAVLLGAGLGGCFALTLVVALDHLPEPNAAGALAALMQGGGFLIAATAPWVVAVLHDATGGFPAGWLLHLGTVMLVAVLTTRLAPAGYARAMRPAGPSRDPQPLGGHA